MLTARIEAPSAPPRRADRVGPNAVTQVARALEAGLGLGLCREVFAAAGIWPHLVDPPTDMVDERDVAQLHAAMVATLGDARAAEISWDAGQRTGDYLLANRIPRAAQFALRSLPRRLAAKLLVDAIARHAWTFCGAGRFGHEFTPNLRLTITGSPICRRLRTEGVAHAIISRERSSASSRRCWAPA